MDNNVQIAFFMLLGFKEASVMGLLDNFSKLCILIYFMFVILDPMCMYWAGWRADFDKPRNCLAQVYLDAFDFPLWRVIFVSIKIFDWCE